jgi:hypothetical protein
MPHYEVKAGEKLVVAGPANVTIKGGEYPLTVESLEDAQGLAPTVTSLDPATAVSGDPDIVMKVVGTNFTADTVIVFGTLDEPTTLISDTEVSTGVKPSLFAPAAVPVKVRNGPLGSNSLDFTFTETGGAQRRKSDAQKGKKDD